MNVSQLKRADEILSRVLDQPEALRQSFLEASCANDSDLREYVARLLEFSVQDSERLRFGGIESGPLWRELLARGNTSSALEAGDRVAAYRILREIGHGGMATVYLAERADGQYESSVALKVLHPLRQTGDVAERFTQESQILATLDHPNIARIIDAGATADGQSFVALDYVDGMPIDAYCDAHRLTVEARLEVFEKVVDAVDCAHRSLIVHRDIKPSNILVTAEGEPKLLDFGIAKVLDKDALPHVSPPTRSALHPMTPEYASPEQIEGKPVTTATDLYQLGYLLYRLLAGRKPYRIERANLVQLVDAVCRQEPEPPSRRFTHPQYASDEPEPNDIANARSVSPRQLGRMLAGDLDNIVLCAMGKASAQTYASASALGDDLRRYRRGLPIAARTSSFGYRATKYFRRHTVGVITAAAVAILLTGLSGFYFWRISIERDTAQTQAQKAERIAAYMQNLLADLAPDETLGQSVKPVEFLDKQIEDLDAQFEDQPETLGVLYRQIARIYSQWGSYQRAKDLTETSIQLLRDSLGSDNSETAQSIARLATTQLRLGEPAEAERLFESIREQFVVSFGRGGIETLNMMNALGIALEQQARYDEAEPIYTENRDLALLQSTDDFVDIAVSSSINLGTTYGRQDRFAEAAAAFTQGLEIAKRQWGTAHTATLDVIGNLALTRERQGRFSDAEALYSEAVAGYTTILGDHHPRTLRATGNLGVVYHRMGRLADARELLQSVTEDYLQQLGPEHRTTTYYREMLAGVLRDQGELAESEQLYRAVLAAEGPDSAGALFVTGELARLSTRMNRIDEARVLFAQALSGFNETVPADHPDRLTLLRWYGRFLLEQDDVVMAEAMLGEAITHLRSEGFQDSVSLAATLVDYGRSLLQQRRFEPSEAALREGLEIQTNLSESDFRADVEQTKRILSELYAAWGKPSPDGF